jgi:pertussis toxin subunit 1
MITKIIATSWVLLLMQGMAMAENPRLLWRIDTRTPNQIFNSGFASWGNNDNVRDHISGASCVELPQAERDTAFISVSADRNWIEQVAAERAMLTPSVAIYIYQIRADSNFYNGERSLQYYANEHPDELIPLLAYSPSRESNEYLSYLEINSQNIVSAAGLVYHQGAIIELPEERNPHYRPLDTQASEEPYVGGQHQPHRSRFTWVYAIPFIGSCFRPRTDLSVKDLDKLQDYQLEALLAE